jgi:hypothetical protein
MEKKITLGDEVIDTVTGFKGIAVARTTWISGCDRITVQPAGITKEGKLFDTFAFDEPTLKIVKKKKVEEKSHKTGGPRPDVSNFKAF